MFCNISILSLIVIHYAILFSLLVCCLFTSEAIVFAQANQEIDSVRLNWSKEFYGENTHAKIHLTFQDQGFHSAENFQFSVSVSSELNDEILEIDMVNFSPFPNYFFGTVYLTETINATINDESVDFFEVKTGDVVVATYTDNSYTSNPVTSQSSIVSDSRFYNGEYGRSWDHVLRIEDRFDNELSNESPFGHPIFLTTSVSNGDADFTQPFVYLIQIKDENQIVTDLMWMTSLVSSGDVIAPSLRWMPTTYGNHTITAFVWHSS